MLEHLSKLTCANPENFIRGGFNFDRFFFLSWWGEWGSKYHYKRAIIRPPGKKPFKWCFTGVLMMAPNWIAGLVALWFFRGSEPELLKKKLYFCGFQGKSGSYPPLWICAWLMTLIFQNWTWWYVLFMSEVSEEDKSWNVEFVLWLVFLTLCIVSFLLFVWICDLLVFLTLCIQAPRL